MLFTGCQTIILLATAGLAATLGLVEARMAADFIAAAICV